MPLQVAPHPLMINKRELLSFLPGQINTSDSRLPDRRHTGMEKTARQSQGESEGDALRHLMVASA